MCVGERERSQLVAMRTLGGRGQFWWKKGHYCWWDRTLLVVGEHCWLGNEMAQVFAGRTLLVGDGTLLEGVWTML